MQLPNDISSLIEKLAKLPQQKLAFGTVVLLLVYIAWLSAEITWSILTPKQTTMVVLPSVKTQQANNENKIQDISGVKSLQLFGEFNQKKTVQEAVADVNVPETTLNVTLAGVVASDDPQFASAIIQNSGQQVTYGIGEQIEGTRAVLERVYVDRVILKHMGKSETLMLDGIKYNAQPSTSLTRSANEIPASNNRSSTVDQRNNRFLAENVNNIKQEIENDPDKITDYLRISPKQVDGQIVGYILMPGKNPEFFKASGLQSGDVAVQMNGYDLSSPLDAAQALQALKTEPEVTLMVERNGEVTEILFSIQN